MSCVRAVPPLLLCALLACHDEPRPHVYGSPPPSRTQLPVAAAAAAAAAELPFGTKGAGARLVSISDATTGAPVAIGGISDSVDVLALVAFGPQAVPAQGARVELVLRGSAMDTTLVLSIVAPAPSVVAHAFRVAGLQSGRYTAVVRLLTPGGRVLAESIPMHLEVREAVRR